MASERLDILCMYLVPSKKRSKKIIVEKHNKLSRNQSGQRKDASGTVIMLVFITLNI